MLKETLASGLTLPAESVWRARSRCAPSLDAALVQVNAPATQGAEHFGEAPSKTLTVEPVSQVPLTCGVAVERGVDGAGERMPGA